MLMFYFRSLQTYHQYYGDSLKVECPVGSGDLVTLDNVAVEIASRLIRIFSKDSEGNFPLDNYPSHNVNAILRE